jgi:hypothetical protein
MNTDAGKHSIGIIKRQERALHNEHAAVPLNQLKTESQSRREIVETIASWIEERRSAIKALPRFKSSEL